MEPLMVPEPGITLQLRGAKVSSDIDTTLVIVQHFVANYCCDKISVDNPEYRN
jgi:hypothetical protein